LRKTHQVLALFIILFILVGLGACQGNQPPGELQTENQAVQLKGADNVDAEITIGAGNLTVTGGANDLMDATFKYNIPASKPEVSYEVNQAGNTNTGNLKVKQPAELNLDPNLTNYRYIWDLKFNNETPIGMEIKLGAGDANMKLGELDLTGLNIAIGAGKATINLSGDYQRNLQAEIRGGVGNLTLILPESTGVQVKVDGVLGNVVAIGLKKSGDYFVNDAYGSKENTLMVHVQGGAGEINMQVGK
jgi:hypothetical protein